ncbi:MAG: phosphotransferase [Patescibacteria group bacterium]
MENILNLIKENYVFPVDIKVDEILQQSGGRVVYKVTSGDNQYILKIADESKTQEMVEKDTQIFSFLKQNNFKNSSVLLETKNKERYINTEGKFVYVLEYIDGKNPESSVATWATLGEIASRLHHIEGYPYKTSFTFASEKPKFVKTAKPLPFGTDYLALANQLPDLDELPQSLIHTDIGPHNSVEKSDRQIILVDWDDAGVGTKILDLGFPLVCQFVTHELIFKEKEALAFYTSYQLRGEITDEEKDILFDAGIFFALMYLPYGDIDKNWARIRFALDNKERISSVVF